MMLCLTASSQCQATEGSQGLTDPVLEAGRSALKAEGKEGIDKSVAGSGSLQGAKNCWHSASPYAIAQDASLWNGTTHICRAGR